MKNLSVQYLEDTFGTDVRNAIEYVETLLPEYPNRLVKPVLRINATSAEVRKYSDVLETFEKNIILYKEQKEKYNEQKRIFDDIIEEYVKEISGLYSVVPEQYRAKVYRLAYENGHSGGFAEIRNHLVDLVDIFE